MGYEKKYVRHMPLCLECGNQIRYGRTDKKFCCEECRTRHHNEQARAGKAFRNKVLSVISRNYEILDELFRSGGDSANLIELTAKGFVPFVMTSYRKSGKHDVCTCYDIKYIMTKTRLYGIEKIQKLSVPL